MTAITAEVLRQLSELQRAQGQQEGRQQLQKELSDTFLRIAEMVLPAIMTIVQSESESTSARTVADAVRDQTASLNKT